jgi:hypothetical protein
MALPPAAAPVTDQRMVPTAAPLAAPAAAAAAAVSSHPVRSLGRVAGLLMVVLLVAAALALAFANGPGGAGPSSTPASDRSAQPQRTADPAGVGDSQSDDPSDDEPEVGEP